MAINGLRCQSLLPICEPLSLESAPYISIPKHIRDLKIKLRSDLLTSSQSPRTFTFSQLHHIVPANTPLADSNRPAMFLQTIRHCLAPTGCSLSHEHRRFPSLPSNRHIPIIIELCLNDTFTSTHLEYHESAGCCDCRSSSAYLSQQYRHWLCHYYLQTQGFSTLCTSIGSPIQQSASVQHSSPKGRPRAHRLSRQIVIEVAPELGRATTRPPLDQYNLAQAANHWPSGIA